MIRPTIKAESRRPRFSFFTDVTHRSAGSKSFTKILVKVLWNLNQFEALVIYHGAQDLGL